jgi:hypothetical protein
MRVDTQRVVHDGRGFVRRPRSLYAFSFTNGLSQPRGRLLRTQTLLPGGKRENEC